MKHFIIEITYRAPMERINQTVGEHRAFLQTGYERGWLLCSGPANPRTGGMVVARAPALDAIQDFFKNDPYQQQGLAEYRFVEFDPVKRQPFLEAWVTEEK